MSGPQEVPIALVGVDFRVASSAWRGALLLASEERQALTAALRQAAQVEGLVVLETCNRVEWVVATAEPRWAAEMLRAVMQERWQQAGMVATTLPVPYVRTGAAAVAHVLRVAVGLESLVVGEREIAGQWNRAVAQARGQGLAAPLLNALQTTVGRTVRKVQRLTHFRHPSRGVHGLALAAAETVPPRLGRKRMAVVAGMGEIGRKTAQLLQNQGWQVVRVNRTAGRATDWSPWSELLTKAAQADVLVVASAGRAPTVDLRGHHVRALVVDLGAPAQVVADPEQPVWGLDELLRLPLALPPEADVTAARELVEAGVAEFLVECGKREQAELLRAAHDAYDRAAYQQLPQLLERELADLEPERRHKLYLGLRELLRDVSRQVVQQVASSARDAVRR
jgi:glutamyl-tRNA reductase